MDRLVPLMDWKNIQSWSQGTMPSPLTTLSSPNAGCNTVIHKEYLSTGPLGKQTFRYLLVQNLTQADIKTSQHIQSANLIDYCFHDFEPAVSVSEQLHSFLETCNTVAKINFSCSSDTSASTASISGSKASMFINSASNDTFSTLRGTETPYNATTGISPGYRTTTKKDNSRRLVGIILDNQSIKSLPRKGPTHFPGLPCSPRDPRRTQACHVNTFMISTQSWRRFVFKVNSAKK